MGASTILKLIPSEDIAVAVLTNIYNREICNTIADEIINICLPDYQKNDEPTSGSTVNQEEILRPTGIWEGYITINGKDIPLSMIFRDNEDVIIETTAQFETRWVFPFAPENLKHRMIFNVFQLNNYWLFGWYQFKYRRCSHRTTLMPDGFIIIISIVKKPT